MLINSQNNQKKTALHIAAAGKNNDIVSFLCSLNATPNIVDNEGNTAAHSALLGIHTSETSNTVEILKCYGNKLRQKNREGKTVLDLMPSNGKFWGDNQIKILLDNHDIIQTLPFTPTVNNEESLLKGPVSSQSYMQNKSYDEILSRQTISNKSFVAKVKKGISQSCVVM